MHDFDYRSFVDRSRLALINLLGLTPCFFVTCASHARSIYYTITIHCHHHHHHHHPCNHHRQPSSSWYWLSIRALLIREWRWRGLKYCMIWAPSPFFISPPLFLLFLTNFSQAGGLGTHTTCYIACTLPWLGFFKVKGPWSCVCVITLFFYD
jgi:hypothetical protein